MIEKEGLEIISIITTLILITIGIHIRLTRFFEAGAPEVVFDTDKKILKMLVIVEKIYAKLILSRYISLDCDDYCKFKAPYIVNHKHNMTKTEKVDPKAKAKRLKNKKQQEKLIEKNEKICQRIIFNTQSKIKSRYSVFSSLFAFCSSITSFFSFLSTSYFSLFVLALPFFCSL